MSEKPTRNPFLASSDFLFSLMMLAVIAMVVSIGAIGIVSVAKNGGSSTEGPASLSGTSIVQVTLTEFAVEFSPGVVPPGNVVFNVHNAGAAQHNLAAVDLDKRTATLNAGVHVLLDLGNVTSDINVICGVELRSRSQHVKGSTRKYKRAPGICRDTSSLVQSVG